MISAPELLQVFTCIGLRMDAYNLLCEFRVGLEFLCVVLDHGDLRDREQEGLRWVQVLWA